VEQQIEAIDQVKGATVELVWEPQWTKDMMSDAAQLQLGLM
jgi:metal-sulfur cluster biosynthetic enzyme